LKLDKVIFTFDLNLLGSNVPLAINHGFWWCVFNKSYSFLHVKEDECIINIMENKNVKNFSIDTYHVVAIG